MRGNRAHRLRGSAALLVGFAASAALHLAAIALLPSRPDAPAAPRGAVVSFEVELRPAPAPAAPVLPAEPGRHPPPPRPAAAAGEVATGEAGARGTAPGGVGRGGLAPPPPRGAPDLHVRWPGAPADGGDSRAGARGRDPGVAATAPRDPLRDWAREQAGRARVDEGLVHPYFGDVGRALLRAWGAERVIERRGVAGYLAQAGENVRTFGRVWHEVAKGYGGAGAAGVVDGGSERMKELSGLPPGPARDALVAAEVRRQLRPAFSKGRLALVRVTQAAADGRLLSVELESPSSDAEIDRAAVEDVRAAARNLPPPPDAARAGRETLVSIWAFELEISITPPLPAVQVEFDEVLGVKDVRVPLDRRIWKRVRLVAVI